MSFMKENIVDIELTSGNIHRSFLNHSIGRNDDDADWFGVRVFRNGEPVNLEGSSVQGFFKQPGRDPIAITSGNYISGNVAEVLLPQACYNYEGQFTLAIKLVSTSEGVTGTMRIVDGMVDNTNVNGAVAPTGAIPTYQEILAVYEQMVAAKEGSVRFDITQELTSAQRLRARNNILGASQADMDAVQAKIGNTPMPTTAQTLTGAIDEHDADIGAIETKIGNTTLPTTAQTLTGAIAEEVTEREAAVSAEASAREAADATKVPNTRKVNGHALSADVTVTKGDVGLGNVDNTSDADKPISTAQAEVNTQVSGIIGDTTLPTTAQTLTGAIAEEVAEREAAVAAEASAREAGDAELKSAIDLEKEVDFNTLFLPEDSASDTLSLNHSGISLSSGSTLSGEWGKRSAITNALLIPPEGLRIEMKSGSDPWVFGIWCYKASTISSGNFVYSPTDKKLIDAGQSVVVLPKNGAKYARVQFRVTDSSDTSYGYRPLLFEGDTGVTPGDGDDTTIRSLVSCYSVSREIAPAERTYNLLSPYIADEAETIGITVDGDEYSGLASKFAGAIAWRWVKYSQNLPADDYTISFEYSTGEMVAGNLVIKFTDSSGTAIDTIQLNRSQEYRKFSKKVTVSQNKFNVLCYVTSSATASAQVKIKNIQLVSGEHNLEYMRTVTAIDNIARNKTEAIETNHIEDTDNLFDLQTAYLNSKEVTLENGILQGTNTAFKTIWLLKDASSYVGKELTITFEGKLYSDSEQGGKQGIVFLNASDETLERVELVKPEEVAFRSYVVTRTVPEGTVKIRFSEFMVASDKVFQIRNIRVRISDESKMTTTDYLSGRTNRTAVDEYARNNIKKISALHDGDLFRLDTTPADISVLSYSELIALWDAFATDYPDNVVKESVGTTRAPESDPTETYTIYRYTITPTCRESYNESGTRASYTTGYERTVLLTSGCHGNEIEGYYGLLLLMRTIYEQGYKYPSLRNLRNKVRFVIIPAWSPYSVEHNQRTMAGGGSPYSYFNAETKPGETQAMIDTLDLFDGELSLWMDFHTDPYAGSSNPRPDVGKDAYPLGCYAYAPAGKEIANSLYELVCDFKNLYKAEYNFTTQRIFFQNNPSDNGHPSYGDSRLPTCVLEIATNMNGFPYALHSGQILKLATEFYGNCVAEGIRATAK